MKRRGVNWIWNSCYAIMSHWWSFSHYCFNLMVIRLFYWMVHSEEDIEEAINFVVVEEGWSLNWLDFHDFDPTLVDDMLSSIRFRNLRKYL